MVWAAAAAVGARQRPDRIAKALPPPAPADCRDDGPASPGTHDHVVRAARTVDEVPGPQRPFLPLDEQQALARENEEILLHVLPVVQAVRLAGLEHPDVDPELLEVAGLPLERPGGPELLVRPPAGVAHVLDDPVGH